ARERHLRERATPAALAARDAVPEIRRAAHRAALPDEMRFAVLREPQERHDRPAAGSGGSLRHALRGSTAGAALSNVREPDGRGGWPPPVRLPYAGGRADQSKDRVAVITGGGSGIGAAMASAFAARGARLVLADIDPAALERTAGALRATGAEVLTVRTDVGDPAQVRALADAAVDRFGAVHVVCNNAGIALFGPMASATHADWEYTMRVDFWGVVHGVETFVPLLLKQGQGGHMVNTASMAGLVGMQWLGVYCAAKFAVVGLTESLHRELTPQGIGVSVLCPMIVQTDINRNSVRNRPEA